MTITPQDIHHKEFKSARFGGYNEEEVDAFLDLVADELERLIHANEDLSQQLEAAKNRVHEFEEMQNSLQNALLTASKAAEVMKEQARQEAVTLIEKAREESEATLNRSREQAREIITRAQAERERIESEIARLKEIRNSYLDSLRQLAASHLREAQSVLEGKKLEAPVNGSEYSEKDLAAKGVVIEDEKITSQLEHNSESRSETTEITLESRTDVRDKEVEDASETRMRPAEVEEEQEEKTGALDRNPPDAKESPAIGEEDHKQKAEKARECEVADQSSREESKTDKEGEILTATSLIDEILGVEGEDNPYVEILKNEKEEKESGKRGRIFRREKKERELFWE